LLQVNVKDRELVLKNAVDYALFSYCPEGEIKLEKTEVVFAGYGISAPQYGHEDYKGISVKDKVVIVLTTNERNTKESFMQKGRSMTFYETKEYKLAEAARQGAKGCLFVQPENAKASIQNIQANFSLSTMHLPGNSLCPVMGVLSRATLYKILNVAGLDSALITEAANPGFKSLLLGVKFSTSLKTFDQYRITQNVMAKISGTENPSEAIVYSSHWDHLGIGKPDENGDSIYNGASDNAIGTAVVLELAARFKKTGIRPKRTLVFLCTGAEELGQFGSIWYVAHTPAEQKQTVANINVDGFNQYGKTRDMLIIGAGHTELETLFEKEIIRQGRYISPDPNPGLNVYFGSDHLSFVKAGIPGLFIFGGTDYVNDAKEAEKLYQQTDAAYHTPSDEYNQRWRFDGTIEDMEAIYNLGKILADSYIISKWKNASEFDSTGIKR
jgi:hypothetical protein